MHPTSNVIALVRPAPRHEYHHQVGRVEEYNRQMNRIVDRVESLLEEAEQLRDNYYTIRDVRDAHKAEVERMENECYSDA